MLPGADAERCTAITSVFAETKTSLVYVIVFPAVLRAKYAVLGVSLSAEKNGGCNGSFQIQFAAVSLTVFKHRCT